MTTPRAQNHNNQRVRYESFMRLAALANDLDVAAAAFGISKRTGYRWRKRAPQKRGRKRLETLDLRGVQIKLEAIADRRIVEGDEIHVPFPSYISIARQYNLENDGARVCRKLAASLLGLMGFRPLVRPKHPALARRWTRACARRGRTLALSR